jgi:acetyl esterase/lipase
MHLPPFHHGLSAREEPDRAAAATDLRHLIAMRWSMVAAPLIALLASACSPVAVLNALSPTSGIVEQSDIAYAPGPRHALDVYAPATGKAAPGHPVVVFLYGGNWDDGDRGIYRFVGAELAARGVVAIIPDYRIYPEVVFPAFMEDAAQAVVWARDHAAHYGGDPKHLFVMGHSAGGQIATLLALDGAYLKTAGMSTHELTGVIGLAGPYDFLPLHDETLKTIFGPEPQRPRSQPINYVTPGAPPMLLIAGSSDDTVDPGNTTRLAARLRSAGDEVTATIYPSVGHKQLIAAFASTLGFLAPVRRDVLAFITARTAAGG